MLGSYINLKKRTDRNNHMIYHIIHKYDFFKNIVRFDAVTHENGAIGCGLSHIQLLESLIQSDQEYGLIIEDDFCILNEDHFLQFCNDFEKIKDSNDWDIIVVTPRGEQIEGTSTMLEHNFQRIRNNQTTTGYIIKRQFAQKLLENFKEAIQLMSQGVHLNHCAIDQYWKRLQENHSFYYYKYIYGGQLEGFSTIENCYVNYNDVFMKQT